VRIAISKSRCCESYCRCNCFLNDNFLSCEGISRVTSFKNFALKSAISKQSHYIHNIASIVIITLNDDCNRVIY